MLGSHSLNSADAFRIGGIAQMSARYRERRELMLRLPPYIGFLFFAAAGAHGGYKPENTSR